MGVGLPSVGKAPVAAVCHASASASHQQLNLQGEQQQQQQQFIHRFSDAGALAEA